MRRNLLLIIILLQLLPVILVAAPFSDNSYIIVEMNARNLSSDRFWNFFKNSEGAGIEVSVKEINGNVTLTENNQNILTLLNRLFEIINQNETVIIPVFIHYEGDISKFDSIIKEAEMSAQIFNLPMGETWPATEYLIQADRRLIFFVNGNITGNSKILHHQDNYILEISGKDVTGIRSLNPADYKFNQELLMVNDLDKLPVKSLPNTLINNNVNPDYINFLLDTWTKFAKRPNFVFVGDNYNFYNYTVSQLSSFSFINGTIKHAGKILERVYWKNPVVTITNGKFSFPIRGGEELILSPFAPGYQLNPKQIVVTGEMKIPESYIIIATPISLSENIKAVFTFENDIKDALLPNNDFEGENYTFTQDFERGNVLKMPENSNINLGDPEKYGFRNSSFTVSCFVKFTDILEFGDNAIIGNYETGYRRGLHLILRSGHPYFGLWANDCISEESLQPNIWYHLAWRYILETGEQTIFLNGKNVGSSSGHPPFSGTGDIHIGSALSSGASMRGYIDDLYFWNRPLGVEEINRLVLNETIVIEKASKATVQIKPVVFKILSAGFVILAILIGSIFLIRKRKTKLPHSLIGFPEPNSPNQVWLFGKFTVIDKEKKDITDLFTPKVRELFLFILIHSFKKGTGASIQEINEQLWNGIPSGKVANNRAVTLNKLRRLVNRIEGIEILSENGYLIAKTGNGFFCDFVEANKICQIPGEMNTELLEAFFMLVKKGRFLKETEWPWLDEIRGHTGNQVIDILLKLASVYIKENKFDKIESIAKRILEIDDLNEEAVYLQVLYLQKTNNLRLAKFNFENFCNKYKEYIGESYSMNFDVFIKHFSQVI
jgi:two-component SAPR family response regulator